MGFTPDPKIPSFISKGQSNKSIRNILDLHCKDTDMLGQAEMN